MAEILGPQSIIAHALPTGVDGDRVAKWALKDGVTWKGFVDSYALALAGLNTELMNQWGWLFGLTEEIMLEYEDGGAVTEAQDITDLDTPDLTGGTTMGHMLDRRVYGAGVGGSKRFFRDLRSTQVSANLRPSIRRLRWSFEKRLLTRLFTNTENAVGSGYDVPFVRGNGGNVDWSPPAYAGEAFDNTHNHYLALDSDTEGFDDAIEAWVETLVEHGHMGPWDLIVAKADVDSGSYHALAKFVELKSSVIQHIDRGGATTGNQYYATGTPDLLGLIGHYQSRYGQVNLHMTNRVPAGYGGGGRSYGQNDPRNPLAVAVHPDSGFGARLVIEPSGDPEFPVKSVYAEMEYGVSVGEDRTNGAAFYLSAGGTWVNPTIS